MGIIKLEIDDRSVETEEGKSILEAALEAEIYIPHLCHHPDLPPIGGCRLCIVEIAGREGLSPSCMTPAENGMAVKTRTPQIDRLRRLAMELMLAGHPADCGTCNKYLNCELQSLKQYLVGDELRVRRRSKLFPLDAGNPLFVHDINKCVACGRCVRACQELRGVGTLFYRKKGKETYTGTAADLLLAESGCRFCGACAEVCPTGAIQDKEELVKGKNRKTALVPCRYTCPAEIDVPRYLRHLRDKNFSAATAVIREKVPFPRVLGYVCDHPCENVCRRGQVNQPVSIRELKRFAAGHDTERSWESNSNRKPLSDKKVAVIGSGPCGLTAAYYLAKQGHGVTVFEAAPAAGGMLRFGIPGYRLPRDALDSEISDIENRGVEIRTGTPVGSLDALPEQDFDAVLVAIGTGKGQKLAIPGADNKGVLISVDFLREVNLGKKVSIGNRVMVLGGGNVAFDCARVARRLGAGEVHIACLESRGQMTASDDEISQGEAEGILIHPARSFTRIFAENGVITGVEFLEVAFFGFDEEKNLQVEVVENSRHIITADTVIFAVGQRPDVPPGFGLETGAGNLITVDTYSSGTGKEGVFAAGDAVNGTSSVIKAIASGRSAAIAIDRFLGGSGNIDEKLAPAGEPVKWLGPGDGFAAMDRHDIPCVPTPERLKGFCPVAQDMDEAAADYESRRCLQCDLRLKITPVKFWGNY